jgi:Ca2+-binding RTX toxin-like protein
VIDGGANLDLILGGGELGVAETGNDTLEGGADFDILLYWYAETPVEVDLGTGSATGEGTDSISGFESVAGSEHDDILRGDQLGNYFFGEGGNDALDGAGGFDISAYWFSEQPIQASLATNTATGEGTDTFADIEGVAGSIDHGDTLTGGDGNDYLDGDGGNDTLVGAAGDDWFLGGLGNDSIDGGPGTFDIVQALNLAPVSINLATGTATGDGSDSLSGVEAIHGTDFADILTGNELANVIFGWGGNDSITGGGGNDQISAGDGTDSVDGGFGTDDCPEAESPVACELAGDPAQWQTHPLNEEAAEAGVVREFAGRLKF